MGATNGTVGTPATPACRIAVDPNNKNVAYAAFGGFGTPAAPLAHVWKTTNLNALNIRGECCLDTDGNGHPGFTGQCHRDRSANRLGRKLNRHLCWHRSRGLLFGERRHDLDVYGTGFPRVTVFGLEIQNPNRIIRAATHGRGMYETFVAKQPNAPLLSQVFAQNAWHGRGFRYQYAAHRTERSGMPRAGWKRAIYIVFTFTTAITGGTATLERRHGLERRLQWQRHGRYALRGISDPQMVTVTANNVTNATGNLPSVAVAVRFSKATRTARARSVPATSGNQGFSGQVVEGGNFRNDVVANGAINSTDLSVAKLKSGNMLPADRARKRHGRAKAAR